MTDERHPEPSSAPPPARTLSLPTIEQPPNASAFAQTPDALESLQELIQTLSLVTGLDICIYPPPHQASGSSHSSLENLPMDYQRHMSEFCQAARRTHDGRGCRGHDSVVTNARAASVGRPFVQVCHRGIAEVIVPILHGEEHLGTLFMGQVVTPQIEKRGFEKVWESVRTQVISHDQLQAGFDQLPRMSEQRLLGIGKLADAAIHGLAERLSVKAFATEVRLQGAPAIRHAKDILSKERCWNIAAGEMADRVHLSRAYFSRLFHRIVGQTFSQYVSEQRMKHARLLLRQDLISVAQVTEQCGFSRQSYFARKFRDIHGMTPTQYRAREKNTS